MILPGTLVTLDPRLRLAWLTLCATPISLKRGDPVDDDPSSQLRLGAVGIVLDVAGTDVMLLTPDGAGWALVDELEEL